MPEPIPPEKRCVHRFKSEIDYQVPEVAQVFARRAINKLHTGKETIPFHEECSQALKDAHWRLAAVRRMTVWINVYEDGSVTFQIG